MLEGPMEEVWFMGSLPNNGFLESIFEKKDLITGF